MLSHYTSRRSSTSAADTAVRLGRLARQAYDWYTSDGDSPDSLTRTQRERIRAAVRNPPSSQPHMPADGRGGGARKGRGPDSRSVNRSDLRTAPPNMFNVPRSIPRNLSTLVVWDVVKARSTVTLSTSAIVEQNYSAALTAHPQNSSWISLFDQYCIPQFSVTWFNTNAPGSLNGSPIVHTALDFDNIGALSSIATIDDYASCVVNDFNTGGSFTRSIRPSVKPTVNATSSAGVQRMWLDTSTAAGLAHTGIRSIWEIVPGTTSTQITVEVTIWFAFRNPV